MKKIKKLEVGEIFGKLTVKHLIEPRNPGQPQRAWLFCSCGGERMGNIWPLRAGVLTHCGCMRGANRITHGGSYKSEYGIWANMRQRCRNKNSVSWKHYGGRGIKIDKRWDTFANFLADMGPRPENHSLDRIDNDGPYAPANCRWATNSQQTSNRRVTRRFQAFGRSQTLLQWAREYSLHPATLAARIRRGQTVEKSLYSVDAYKPREYVRPKQRQTELTVDGITKTVKQWAADHSLKTATIHMRLRRGYSHAEAVAAAPYQNYWRRRSNRVTVDPTKI